MLSVSEVKLPAVPKSSNRLAAEKELIVLVINFRTREKTCRCIQSLLQSNERPRWIFILDNSESDDGLSEALGKLVTRSAAEGTDIRCFRSEKNLGFAEGSNFLFRELEKIPDWRFVLLLNNDAIAQPDLLGSLRDALVQNPQAGMAGARMHKLDDPEKIDSLGIVLYRSLMPADRYDVNEPYLGPTGGCAMITRECLTRLYASAGYYFDPSYFCYCEDTDLALRANMLGYRPVFVDQILALHEGQASTHQGYNPFISYHGQRNAIFLKLKLMPLRLLIKYGVLSVLFWLLGWVRNAAHGHPLLSIKIIVDVFRSLPRILSQRHRLARTSILTSADFEMLLAPRFYRRGFISEALKQLPLLGGSVERK
jgi:GT2 family glycosyltransferase